MDVSLDINAVGAFALILGAFGYFVRATVKGAIADLKDALAKIYMSAAEVSARFAALHNRIDNLEKVMADHVHIFHTPRET